MVFSVGGLIAGGLIAVAYVYNSTRFVYTNQGGFEK